MPSAAVCPWLWEDSKMAARSDGGGRVRPERYWRASSGMSLGQVMEGRAVARVGIASGKRWVQVVGSPEMVTCLAVGEKERGQATECPQGGGPTP